MTNQSNSSGGLKGIASRVPPILVRVLLVATAIYFLGFLWTFTHGSVGRLFIPFQWELFYTQRSAAEVLGGQWLLYGASVPALFVNWVILLALISGAYFAYAFIAQRKK